eukprot:scaffold444669_cov18-Prasinocladus_malaysianus.AAC.1
MRGTRTSTTTLAHPPTKHRYEYRIRTSSSATRATRVLVRCLSRYLVYAPCPHHRAVVSYS